MTKWTKDTEMIQKNNLCSHASPHLGQRHIRHDVLKRSTVPPFFAAARLSAMLSGSDEVYANCMVVDQVR